MYYISFCIVSIICEHIDTNEDIHRNNVFLLSNSHPSSIMPKMYTDVQHVYYEPFTVLTLSLNTKEK